MKKLIGVTVLCMGLVFSGPKLFAQDEGLPGDDENPYGGVCCQMDDLTCPHPIGLVFADSIWMSGQSTC